MGIFLIEYLGFGTNFFKTEQNPLK